MYNPMPVYILKCIVEGVYPVMSLILSLSHNSIRSEKLLDSENIHPGYQKEEAKFC